jgi:hypothetical protein
VKREDAFLERFEATALLRVLARDDIGMGNHSSARWANKWEVHHEGIRVKIIAVLAWSLGL